MNAILLNVGVALGALVPPSKTESRMDINQRKEALRLLETLGAEWAVGFALLRISEVICSIPKDRLLADRVFTLKLFDFGLKFETFLLHLRKLDFPRGQGSSQVSDSFDKLDVFGILGDIIDSFEPSCPTGKVINNTHNKYSVILELLKQAECIESKRYMSDPKPLPNHDINSPRYMRKMADALMQQDIPCIGI